MIPDDFFAQNPSGRQLFQAIKHVIDSIGESTMRVSKSQIAFRRKRNFAIVWWPELEPVLAAAPELLDALEVEPQAMWIEAPEAPEPYRLDDEALELVLVHPQAKLAHGVGFPVGSARP